MVKKQKPVMKAFKFKAFTPKRLKIKIPKTKITYRKLAGFK